MSPNDVVRIKPTEVGWAKLRETVAETNAAMKAVGAEYRSTGPVADKDGYITGQFWSLLSSMKWRGHIGEDCLFSDLQPIEQTVAHQERRANAIYKQINKAIRLTILVLVAFATLATPALGMLIYNVHEPLALALVTAWGVAWGRWFVPGFIVTWKQQQP